MTVVQIFPWFSKIGLVGTFPKVGRLLPKKSMRVLPTEGGRLCEGAVVPCSGLLLPPHLPEKRATTTESLIEIVYCSISCTAVTVLSATGLATSTAAPSLSSFIPARHTVGTPRSAASSHMKRHDRFPQTIWLSVKRWKDKCHNKLGHELTHQEKHTKCSLLLCMCVSLYICKVFFWCFRKWTTKVNWKLCLGLELQASATCSW